MREHEDAHVWELVDAQRKQTHVEMQARLITGDFAMLLEAARRGLGIALLPDFVCAAAIQAGIWKWCCRAERAPGHHAFRLPEPARHVVGGCARWSIFWRNGCLKPP